MIPDAEIAARAQALGVPESQIVRDHLISHTLEAIASLKNDTIVFFGGTALCRTHLRDLRLSEDIDIIVEDLTEAEPVRSTVTKALRRQFPTLTWDYQGRQHDVDTWHMLTGESVVNIQFALWRQGWKAAIPVSPHPVDLRYSDLPDSVEMTVPTGGGFAAMKVMAWMDRHAPRDLVDLAALADAGYLNHEALSSVHALLGYKPTAQAIGNVAMTRVEAQWATELDHQASNLASPKACLASVRQALDGLDHNRY